MKYILLEMFAFLSVRFSFLFIANKFFYYSLLPWKRRGWGGSSAVRKLYRTGGVEGEQYIYQKCRGYFAAYALVF